MICGVCGESFAIYPSDEYAADGAVHFCWRCSGLDGPKKTKDGRLMSWTFQYPCVAHPSEENRALGVKIENTFTCEFCGTFNKGRAYCFTCGSLNPKYLSGNLLKSKK